MEVKGRQHGDPLGPLQRLEQAKARIAESNIARLRAAREILVELSRSRLPDPLASGDVDETGKTADIEVVGQSRQTEEKGRAEGQRDHIDLSEVAKAATLGTVDTDREAKVEELKKQYDTGALNTVEKIELAAEGILDS